MLKDYPVISSQGKPPKMYSCCCVKTESHYCRIVVLTIFYTHIFISTHYLFSIDPQLSVGSCSDFRISFGSNKLQVISEAEGVAITAVYLRLCAHANALEYFARGRLKLMFG